MSCSYYSWKGGSFFGDYWCNKKDARVDSDTYYKYCRNWDYGDCPIYKHEESSPPCFITTVLCQILGLPDDHETLNALRNFRDNILQKDKQYEEILKIYDVIGPLVADSIRKDANREKLALDLYKLSLLPIVEEIKKQNYTRAIKHYLYMTLSLVSEYNLRNTYNCLQAKNFGIKDFDQSTAGHGYTRTLSLN